MRRVWAEGAGKIKSDVTPSANAAEKRKLNECPVAGRGEKALSVRVWVDIANQADAGLSGVVSRYAPRE